MRFDDEAIFNYEGVKNVMDEWLIPEREVNYPCGLLAFDDKFTTRAVGTDSANSIRIRLPYPVEQPHSIKYRGILYGLVRNPHHKFTTTFYLIERVNDTN